MSYAPHAYVLEYSLHTKDDGVYLKIWEPARGIPSDVKRVKPYLFSANYHLSSKDAALQVLNQHLLSAGAKAIPAEHLMTKGHLQVVPHPTDEIWL